MSDPLDRRSFTALSAGFVLGAAADLTAAPEVAPRPRAVPTEAPFDMDYPAPNFTPSWRRPQINRRLVQDFVVYAHMDPVMTGRLLDKEPGLVNAYMNWGGDDWESGLGAASHMGRRDIVSVMLDRGARPDLFCAAMLGMTDVVRTFLTLQPKLIDAKGPHGFTLHFHAQVGGREAEAALEYLQSVKRIELRPNPFLKK